MRASAAILMNGEMLNPNSTFDANNQAAFGKIGGTRGAFSDIGTSNSNLQMVVTIQF
jgi:hypothetical protein